VHRLVGQRHVPGVAVGVGIDGDGLDAHLRAVTMTRQAISPRLAIRILVNMVAHGKVARVGARGRASSRT
jgi:hypothetical protein